MQTFPAKSTKLLNACNIPVAALLILAIRVLLIVLRNCTKNNSTLWIRFVLWSTYLGADTVATFALGAILNKLLDLCDDEKNAGCEMDAKTELVAFWAPFLLLHMGGPKAITSYALEDNELWLRQLLTLAGQTVGAHIMSFIWLLQAPAVFHFYPFQCFWLCGERICALRSASTHQLQDSLFNPSSEVSVFKGELDPKSIAGNALAEEKCTDGSSPKVDFSVIIDNSNIPEQSKLLPAP